MKTDPQTEAAYQTLREAFAKNATIAEMREHVNTMREGGCGLVAVLETEDDVFILGGLSFGAGVQVVHALGESLERHAAQIGMLTGQPVGEA